MVFLIDGSIEANSLAPSPWAVLSLSLPQGPKSSHAVANQATSNHRISHPSAAASAAAPSVVSEDGSAQPPAPSGGSASEGGKRKGGAPMLQVSVSPRYFINQSINCSFISIN